MADDVVTFVTPPPADEPAATAVVPTDPPAPTTVTAPEEPTGDKVDYKAELEKWKTFSRTQEKRAKENAKAAEQLAKIENDKKSETERLNDTIAARDVELQTFRVADIRREAAAKAGLEADMAQFITAADPDEAAAQAKTLSERLTKTNPPGADFRQGPRAPGEQAQTADQWLRAAARRR